MALAIEHYWKSCEESIRTVRFDDLTVNDLKTASSRLSIFQELFFSEGQSFGTYCYLVYNLNSERVIVQIEGMKGKLLVSMVLLSRG